MKETKLEKVFFVLIYTFLLFILFQIGFLIFGFINADQVVCNLVWCQFIFY